MANTSTRRTVSRPGVSPDGGGAKFVSPYQPPSAVADFEGDLVLLDPNSYTPVHVRDFFWRVKPPGPAALQAVAAVADAKGGQQIHAINSFLQVHMHPEDFRHVIMRLLDPNDLFDDHDYMDLYRQAVTVGTARPFRQWWASLGPPPPAGASSARSSRSGASRHRARR
jgi:hypothetical protein